MKSWFRFDFGEKSTELIEEESKALEETIDEMVIDIL